MRIRIAAIFGTRPDAIKMAPVLTELQAYRDEFHTVTIATAQHREMLDQVLDIFKIRVNYDLDVMQPRQSLAYLVKSVLSKLDGVIRKIRPDLILVQGDTSTTFVASLAAFYSKIPVGHVEAGLRTEDKYRPYPEEMNRRLTTAIADFHFAPTRTARNALLAENIPAEKIYLTGNTVIDALLRTVRKDYFFSHPFLRKIVEDCRRLRRKMVLITCHRRENWGAPMAGACRAIRKLAERHREVTFIFPVHLNPVVREVVYPILKGLPNVFLTDPLEYESFVNLMNEIYLVLTDSGGMQEEAPSLGKPVLVLREVTERPEAVVAGTVKLVGMDERRIVTETSRLLDSLVAYKRMASATNPYGDGKAAWRIVQTLRRHYGFRRMRVKEFRGY